MVKDWDTGATAATREGVKIPYRYPNSTAPAGKSYLSSCEPLPRKLTDHFPFFSQRQRGRAAQGIHVPRCRMPGRSARILRGHWSSNEEPTHFESSTMEFHHRAGRIVIQNRRRAAPPRAECPTFASENLLLSIPFRAAAGAVKRCLRRWANRPEIEVA